VDLVFWIPWTIGFVVFVVWVGKPIAEFRRLWREKHKSGTQVLPPGRPSIQTP
jgi:hypothetical protein